MKKIFLEILKKSLCIESMLESLSIENDDIVYLGGSLIEGEYNELSKGMGNLKSDLDLFIIKNNESYKSINFEYDFKVKKIDFKINNGINLDIEYFDRNSIDKLIINLENVSFNRNERISNMIDIPEGFDFFTINDFLTRLYYGKCIYNESGFNTLKNRISFANFKRLYSDYVFNAMENVIDDASGNIDILQYQTALYCTRDAFINFLKFLILDEGEFVDRDKWVIIKFLNIFNKRNKYNDVFNMYNKLFLTDLSNNIVLEKTVKESISFIRHKAENIMVGDLI